MKNRYKQIIDLSHTGITIREISRRTGVSANIVQKLICHCQGIRQIKPSEKTKQTFFNF
jgi:transposase